MVDQKVSAVHSDLQHLPNLSDFVKTDEPPYCPVTGLACARQARRKAWLCESSNYAVSIDDWDTVLIHAGVALQHFTTLGIEHIIYNGVPINVMHAVTPSHLLPLIVLRCIEMSAMRSLGNGFMLTLATISEEAEISGNTLLPEIVTVNEATSGTLSESLQIMIAVIDTSVKSCLRDNPLSNAIDYSYLMQNPQALELVG